MEVLLVSRRSVVAVFSDTFWTVPLYIWRSDLALGAKSGGFPSAGVQGCDVPGGPLSGPRTLRSHPRCEIMIQLRGSFKRRV